MMDLDKLAKPFLKNISPYRPGKPIEQLKRERGITGPIAKLASNENPYPPGDRIKRAVLDALEMTNRYPESGAPELTDRLADVHEVDPANIFVAHGTNEILDLLVRAYVEPDENCVFSELSFVIYKLIAMQCGVQFIQVPQRSYTHDLVAMAGAVSDRTKLVFICNPNNPTGTYNTSEELERFLADAPDTALIILDEAYYEFVNEPDYPASCEIRKRHENVVVLRTFSKYYSLAGIRVGYAIADPRVVETLNKIRQPFNVNRLAQSAALAAIDCTDDLRPFVEETIREREVLRNALLGLGCECPPTQTNFVFAVLKDYPRDICSDLEASGIIVRPMAPFGAPENAFRVNTGTPDENKRFLAEFETLVGTRS